MFGKKVVCVSLFTLLAAAPLHGIFWSNWWGRSSQQKEEDLKKVRNGFEKISEDVLNGLKDGESPFYIANQLYDIAHKIFINNANASYGQNPKHPHLPYFGTTSKNKLRDILEVQTNNRYKPNKIRKKAERVYFTCIKHKPNDDRSCRNLTDSCNYNRSCRNLTDYFVKLFAGEKEFKRFLRISVRNDVRNDEFFEKAKKQGKNKENKPG